MTQLEPVRKAVTVRRSITEAFEVFTQGISRWWPLAKYSVSRERAARCAIEPRAGGEVFEVGDDGAKFVWGTVLVWEPPHRFVMTWHPGRDASSAQEVEIRFTAGDGGTRVELEHRGWEKLGDRAAEVRR